MPSAEWTADDLRAWLRAHRSRPRRGWADWYYLFIAAAVLVPMTVSLASKMQLPLLTCATSPSVCTPDAALFPSTWVALSALVVGATSSLAGPLAVSAATASWILSTPLDREHLLSPGMNRLIIGGVGIGLLSGLLLVALVGGTPLWVSACVSATTLAVLSALLAQQDGGWHSLWRPAALAVAGWGLLALLMVAHIFSPVLIASGVTVCAALLTWRIATRARVGLAHMSRFSLAEQAGTRSGLMGAAASADTGLGLDIMTSKLTGTPSSTRLNAPGKVGWQALASYELQRLVRRSPRLLWGPAMATVVAAFIPMQPRFALAMTCITLVPALGLTLSSLRVLVRSRGLARSLGLSGVTRTAATTSGAALAAVGWMTLTSSLLVTAGTPAAAACLLAWAAGTAGLAGAMRWVAVPPPNFFSGILMTDAGPVPVGALLSVLAGFDSAFVVAGLVLLNAPPLLCALLATLTLVWAVVTVSRPRRS